MQKMENSYSEYFEKNWIYSKLDIDADRECFVQFAEMNFWNELKSIKGNAKIVEIWSGHGKFAFLAKKYNLKNYIWFELDSAACDKLRADFPDYKFLDESADSFLESNTNSVDLVFTSHVFEHLDSPYANEIAKKIRASLKIWGMWINIMPNMGSLYFACHTRYIDLTHENWYTDNSFSQLLLQCWYLETEIEHRNNYVGFTKLKRMAHLLVLRIHKIILQSMGYWMPKIHSTDIISVITKR